MDSGYTLQFKPCSEIPGRGRKILIVEKSGSVSIVNTENKFYFCAGADCYGSSFRFDTEQEFTECVKAWAYIDGISEVAK